MSIQMMGVGGCVARFDNTDKAVKPNRQADDKASVIRQLRDRLEHHRQRRAKQAGWTRRHIPTGLAPLDEVLPGGGLPCGAIAEMIADGCGVGLMSLAMRIAGNSIKPTKGRTSPTESNENHHSIVLLDVAGDFYPPAVMHHGLALDRLIVLRVRHAKDAFWAVDQSLRCRAVAVVIAPFTKLDECASRRLQLAAESSGSMGLILMPARRNTKSFAAVSMLIEGVHIKERKRLQIPAASPMDLERNRLCRITLLKVREGIPAQPVLVNLQHETGIGSLHTLLIDRSVAKTG